MSLLFSGLNLNRTIVFRQTVPEDLSNVLNTIANAARLSYPTSTILQGRPAALIPQYTLGGDHGDPSAITDLNSYFQNETKRLTQQPKFNIDAQLADVKALNRAPYLLDTNKALDAISKALAPFLNPTADFVYIGVKKTERYLVPDFNDYKEALKKHTWGVGGAYVTYDFKQRKITNDAPLREIASLLAKTIALNVGTAEGKNQMKAYLMTLINDTLLASTVNGDVTQMAERITPSVAHLFVLISEELQKQGLTNIPQLFPKLGDEPIAEPLKFLSTKVSGEVNTLKDALFARALGVSVSGNLAKALLGKEIDPTPFIQTTLAKYGFTVEQLDTEITELKNQGLMVSRDKFNQVAAFLTEKGIPTAPPLSEHVQPARLFPNGKIHPMFEATVDSNGHIKISAELLNLLKSESFKAQGNYQLNYVKTKEGKVLVFPNLWSNPDDSLDPNNLLSHDYVALGAHAAGDLIVDENGNALIVTSRSAHFCAQDPEKAEHCATSQFPTTEFKDINWANTKAYEASPKVLTAAEFAALQLKIANELAK